MTIPSRYQFDKNITGGGMSNTAIYLDKNLGRKVLIKSVSDSIDQPRLIDEIKALQNIRSRHVVQIFDVIRNAKNEITHIVEEYIDGSPITQKHLFDNNIVNLYNIFQISKGISDIHESGQIHRDIKAENMLVDGEGYIKIFDFGLSKKPSPAGVAVTKNIIGTPGHMAPELFESTKTGGYAFSGAVDVFAFGALLLRAMIGKLPAELITLPPKKIQSPGYFAAAGFGLSSKIVENLDRCLAADPQHRPSMKDVCYLLERDILKDRHKIMVCTTSQTYNLDSSKRSILLKATGKGSFALDYDGYDIIISQVTGTVLVNNMQLSDGDVIPKSCVIVLGTTGAGGRSNVTIDTSHPGVDL